jgi:hypothetical protein
MALSQSIQAAITKCVIYNQHSFKSVDCHPNIASFIWFKTVSTKCAVLFIYLFVYLFIYFCSAGAWSQSLALDRQVFCHLSCSVSPFLHWLFWVKVSLYSLAWPQPQSSCFELPHIAATSPSHWLRLGLFAWCGLKLQSTWSLPPKWLGLQAWAIVSCKKDCFKKNEFSGRYSYEFVIIGNYTSVNQSACFSCSEEHNACSFFDIL